MQHVAMTLQRINRRNVGKTNQLGKEAGSATVSATGSQRLPDKKPRQGVIISVKGSYLLRMSLCSAFPYVPNTARNGHLLVSNPFISGILQVYFSVNFFIACPYGPSVRADLEAIMAKNAAATKRNNRKIHARKFLATPEGKAWLERKKAEEAELKMVSEARKFV